MEKTYAIVLRPEPEGGFTVRVPALPEIVSYGEDAKEALAMAEDAIELCLIHRKELGEDAATTARSSSSVSVHRPERSSGTDPLQAARTRSTM